MRHGMLLLEGAKEQDVYVLHGWIKGRHAVANMATGPDRGPSVRPEDSWHARLEHANS